MLRVCFAAILCLFPLCPQLTWASSFTPLEWQQVVEKHGIAAVVGQRKHTTWTRDENRNFIDDEIERRFRPGEIVNVVVDLNTCLTPPEIRQLLAPFGRITYIGKLVTFVNLDSVRFEQLEKLAALPQVAMIEWQVPGQIMSDVGSRAVQSRASATFSPNTAQDSNFNGNNVVVAILDTGVDNQHEAFAGKFVAGFNSLIFEDTNGNGQDDSCEPAPLGNGVCTDAADEPADGTTNPADVHSHGSHVAGIAIGNGTAGRVCSTPDDGSATNCAGVASGARLVDVQICNALGGCSTTDVMEALDWIGINAQRFDIRVINMSIGYCTADDGTNAMSQQANYVVALGVVAVIALGNSPNCGLAAGTQRVMFPGSSSFAITVAGSDDRDTVTRNDDTNYTGFLRGPRSDFNAATPNLLALKPDLAAPGQNIVAAQFNTMNTYFSQSGTSMAAPNVAGAAAVLLQVRPTMDPGSLKTLLKQTADTQFNAAQFPAVDANWDNDLGSGLLNVWPAVSAAAAGDVRFPTCVGTSAGAGQPCNLPAPQPRWNNSTDISTATAPKVGVANTITAQVRNDGAAPATVLVNFGVYVFAAGNNQFFHIGSVQVTIPAGATSAVNQAWTPAASNHQCIQVSIDFGFDTNFANNITQRNVQVAPSVFNVRIENPFMVPAVFRVEAKSSRDNWQCRVGQTKFDLRPFEDCPKEVRVAFDAPAGARPGDRANCDVAVYAAPRGGKEQLIGGVTVQTYVPKPCRIYGAVVDEKGAPVAGARIALTHSSQTLEEAKPQPSARVPTFTAVTDAEGVFAMRLTPDLPYAASVDRSGIGSGRLIIRPECGAGTIKFVLTKAGLRVAGVAPIEVIDRLDKSAQRNSQR